MSKEIWNHLVEFTENEIAPMTNAVLSRETRLVEDLGLIGDDADEFMGNFSKEFAVEGGDFEFDDYFPPEGFDLIGMVGGLFSRDGGAKTITLGMLEHAAELGVWDTDQINSHLASGAEAV